VASRKLPRFAWIAEVLVTDATAGKIRAKHELDPGEIATLVRSSPPRIGRWVSDEHGTRLYVQVTTSARQDVLAVLYPANGEVWHLVSAYMLAPRQRA
jgi:hypothetical protein